jgi:26S proteasome regulatory subunit N10
MLEMIGKKLKKNSVALDIVNFGEEDEGKTEKLEALLAAVNNNDSSHMVHVPPGPNALSDVLIRFVGSILFFFLFFFSLCTQHSHLN